MSDLRSELTRRQSDVKEVLAVFSRQPEAWIHWSVFAKIAACAWRTRISDARKIVKKAGGVIENRQYRRNGEVVSEYRFLPYTPLGRDTGERIDRVYGLLFDVSPRP